MKKIWFALSILITFAVLFSSCVHKEWFQTTAEAKQVKKENRSWRKHYRDNGVYDIKQYPSISH